MVLKKFCPILFLLTLTTNINAEGLKYQTFSTPIAPDENTLLRTAIGVSDYSLSRLKNVNPPEKDCSEKQVQITPPKEMNEAFCFCELTDEEIKKFPFIGEFKAIDYDLVSGNDNLLHGIMRRSDAWLPYDGDDKGRTFSIGNDFTILGSEGELKLGLHTTGFGKLTTVNGQKWSPDSKRYLEFIERDTLSIRADKYLHQKENSKYRLFGEFKLDHFNDEANGARYFQEKWHYAFRDLGMVQYKYLNHMKPMTEATASIGIGRDIDFDLSRFKCQFRSEVQVGLSTYDPNPIVAKGRVSAKVTHGDIPWIAVSLWAQEAKDLLGRESGKGLIVSFPIKGKNVTITPYFGVEKHKSTLDRSFASDPKKSSEAYHVLGISVRY